MKQLLMVVVLAICMARDSAEVTKPVVACGGETIQVEFVPEWLQAPYGLNEVRVNGVVILSDVVEVQNP
jgi:hypothetical protein